MQPSGALGGLVPLRLSARGCRSMLDRWSYCVLTILTVITSAVISSFALNAARIDDPVARGWCIAAVRTIA